MSSADHNLNSALQRKIGYHATEPDVREAEVEILRQAREWGLGYGDTDHQDDLQLLADLQHFGVPTRLIDFTSNPMTALWFACLSSSSQGVSKSGLLLALNVSGWESHSTIGGDAAQYSAGEELRPEQRTLAKALAAGKPFLVKASHPNDRLRAQEGFFAASIVPTVGTFRRSLYTPFFGLNVPIPQRTQADAVRSLLTGGRTRGAPANIPYVAIIIPAGFKPRLRKYLQGTYNRSERVLFPDFQGFEERGDYRRLLGTLNTYEQFTRRKAPTSLEPAT